MKLFSKNNFLTAHLIAVSFFITFSVNSQEIPKEMEEEAKKWMEAVAERVKKDASNDDTAAFTKKALLNATKEQETSTVKPKITKDGLDLDSFMARYRLDQGTMKKALKEPAKFLVFVSFSMDQKAIRSIGRDVGKLGGTLVLRGLVDNSLKSTTAKIAELQQVLQGEETQIKPQVSVPVEMIIDPTLFQKFGVKAVPSFVVSEAIDTPCLDNSCSESVPPFDRLAGMVPVQYALKTIAERGFEARSHAKALLKKLEAQQ